MARNIPNQPNDETPTATNAPAQATATAMPGGAAGIVPNTGDMGARNGAVKASYDAGARPGEPIAKRYQILTGGQIMYNGVRVTIRPGKVVHEGCYDLKLLRSQGIQLKELAPDEVPPQQLIHGV